MALTASTEQWGWLGAGRGDSGGGSCGAVEGLHAGDIVERSGPARNW